MFADAKKIQTIIPMHSEFYGQSTSDMLHSVDLTIPVSWNLFPQHISGSCSKGWGGRSLARSEVHIQQEAKREGLQSVKHDYWKRRVGVGYLRI